MSIAHKTAIYHEIIVAEQNKNKLSMFRHAKSERQIIEEMTERFEREAVGKTWFFCEIYNVPKHWL